jgi:tetrahydromethanopterin S-methyltransferase subunit G
MEEVLSELKQINQRLDSIENRLDSVESRLDSIENRLEIVEFEQQQIKQAVLETNEKVNRLAVIQESQHRIIELLSARSIQHEAEVKKISDLQAVV